MSRLTKRLVDSVRPSGRDVVVWDGELRGFGLKVTPTGKRSYFCYYRMLLSHPRRPAAASEDR